MAIPPYRTNQETRHTDSTVPRSAERESNRREGAACSPIVDAGGPGASSSQTNRLTRPAASSQPSRGRHRSSPWACPPFQGRRTCRGAVRNLRLAQAQLDSADIVASRRPNSIPRTSSPRDEPNSIPRPSSPCDEPNSIPRTLSPRAGHLHPRPNSIRRTSSPGIARAESRPRPRRLGRGRWPDASGPDAAGAARGVPRVRAARRSVLADGDIAGSVAATSRGAAPGGAAGLPGLAHAERDGDLDAV
jgi:hypothetical protein